MSGSIGAGTISFQYYPVSNRVPGVFAEIDPSGANTGTINQRTLLIGQKLAAGTAAVGVPYIFTSLNDAQNAFGTGSMLWNMAQRYRAIDAFGELWFLPLADEGSGVAASGTVAITGPATAVGTLSLYVAGVMVPTAVNSGDSAATIATNVAAAINNVPTLPVTATAATGTVTITARHKGLTGNDIDIRLNYLGTVNGEVTPAGVGVTITAMANGTQNPTQANLNTALANLSDMVFDFICFPYTDATSLNTIGTFLNDAAGRWSWTQEIFGHAFSAYRGTFSAATTFGVTRNDQHVSIMAYYDSPTPPAWWAADITAACAVSLRADPAMPLQSIAINVLPPTIANRFYISERNSLLYDGLSTYRVNRAGQVFIDRMVTTYQLNAAGAPDNSYLDVETMFTLMYLIRDMRTFLQTQFARKKLVSDGTRITPGSGMVSALTIKMAAIARYRVNADLGYCQNPDQFALQAQAQNAGNGLVKLLLPFQLANQLRQIAMLVNFTKP